MECPRGPKSGNAAGAGQAMSDIFISYAREDRPRAEMVASALEGHGWSVWWDRDLRAGKNIALVIEEELGKARCVAVLWSATSVRRDWVIDEAREGKDRGILVPVLIENVRPPLGFRSIHSADLTAWEGHARAPVFLRLCSDIEALIGAAADQPSNPPPIEKPASKAPRVNPLDGLTYVFISPGPFVMGCSPGDSECFDDEKPPHAERIVNGFWLSRTEVTQAAWKLVMNSNPSSFMGDQLPVENVDWGQAIAYCEAIGGRLPTEKEWEYAARAGTARARYGSLDAIAWYKGNSSGTTHPVALKEPNAFGLYDMLGNVWEWVADDYIAYPGGSVDAPIGRKVVRGGSWDNNTRVVRASYRVGVVPTARSSYFGFRCAGDFR